MVYVGGNAMNPKKTGVNQSATWRSMRHIIFINVTKITFAWLLNGWMYIVTMTTTTKPVVSYVDKDMGQYWLR